MGNASKTNKMGDQIRNIHRAHEHQQSLLGKAPATERHHLEESQEEQRPTDMTSDFEQEHANFWRNCWHQTEYQCKVMEANKNCNGRPANSIEKSYYE